MDTSSTAAVPTLSTLYSRLIHLETNAYASVVAAFRAQGELTWEKKRILDSLKQTLHISNDRDHAEMLKVESDPFIQQIRMHCDEAAFDRSIALAPVISTEHVVAPAMESNDGTYALHDSDTESVSDYAEQHKDKLKKRPGRKPKNPQLKRGRKKRDVDDVPYATPVAASKALEVSPTHDVSSTPQKRGRGRPKGSGVKAPSKKKKDSNDVDNATPMDIKDEEEDFHIDPATPLTQVEEIAEVTAKEIEVLEQKLHDTTDEIEKVHIMKDVKRKRGHLMTLINFLEQTPMDEEPTAQA